MKYVNVVPTEQTRDLASRLQYAARREGGADAAQEMHDQLQPEQGWALIGLLLDELAQHSAPVRSGPATLRPFIFTPEERRAGTAAYRRGVRTPTVVEQHREYGRELKRNRAARAAAGGA